MPFLRFLVLVSLFNWPAPAAGRGDHVKAMFVFGESLLDSGNNNYLNTSKSNYFPYGIDFPLGATGRFTNGRNPADFLSQLLGLSHFLPPFYDPNATGSSILAGVNFACGGATLLDSSTDSVPSFSKQVDNFYNKTLVDLKSQLNESLPSYLADSIFLFSFGGVDYFNYVPETPSGNLTSFKQSLLSTYTVQLKRLYDNGARRFVVLNLLPSGCAPYFFRHHHCWTALNDAILSFNNELIGALQALKQSLEGFLYVHVNISRTITSVLDDPEAYGIEVTDESCCVFNNGLCVEGLEPCRNRTTFVYFDGGHPTEKVYLLMSTKAYSSKMQSEVYPYNVQVLAALNGSDVTGDSSFYRAWNDA